MKLFLVSLLFITGCGLYHKPIVKIDPRVQPIVDQWHKDSKEILGYDVSINDLIIDLANLDGTKAGLCQLETYHSPHIYIDYYYWNVADDIQKLLMVYHEMGHCVLFRDHNNTMIFINDPGIVPYYAPVSIMYYAAALRDDYWLGHRIALLTEYFSVLR